MNEDLITVICKPARLDALQRLNLLDQLVEPALDRLAQLAARVIRAPIALVTLVDANRQFFASQVGLAEPWATTRETPLSHSFCQHVVVMREPLILSDAREHPLVKNNLAIADLGVVAYVGIPLITSDGHALGSFCVIDTVPRQWTEEEIAILRDLTASVVTELELRRELVVHQEAEKLLQIHFRTMVEHLGQGLLITDVKGKVLYVNPQLATLIHSTPELLAGMPANDMFSSPTVNFQQHQWQHQEHISHYDAHIKRRNGEQLLVDIYMTRLQDDDRTTIGTLALVTDVTERHGLFAAIQAGRERLQTLSRQLLTAQENERRTIARELHDQIGQSLTAAHMNLQAMVSLSDEPVFHTRLEDSISLLEQVLQQVRTLSLDLRPSLLDDLGLGAAVRWYMKRQAERAGFHAEVSITNLSTRPGADIETTCFRILQEAITNIVRYAQAKTVYVEVQTQGKDLLLVIRDDGKGFDVQAAQQRAAQGGSLGLLGMQERALLVGGQFDIQSKPGTGTIVRAQLPLSDQRGVA